MNNFEHKWILLTKIIKTFKKDLFYSLYRLPAWGTFTYKKKADAVMSIDRQLEAKKTDKQVKWKEL